jgi:hypothetical protein
MCFSELTRSAILGSRGYAYITFGMGETTFQSYVVEAEIWFVSLDWLIKIHPSIKWLQTARDVILKLIEERGFVIDD